MKWGGQTSRQSESDWHGTANPPESRASGLGSDVATPAKVFGRLQLKAERATLPSGFQTQLRACSWKIESGTPLCMLR